MGIQLRELNMNCKQCGEPVDIKIQSKCKRCGTVIKLLTEVAPPLKGTLLV